MMYPKRITATITAIAIFISQLPTQALAAATDYIASQEAATIEDLYSAIDSGNLDGVKNFDAKVKQMLGQSGLTNSYKVNYNFTDANGDTPLIRAARNGKTDIVDYLMKQGANPNLTNNNGANAMTVAAQNAHYNVVGVLAGNSVPVPLEVSREVSAVEKSFGPKESTLLSGNTITVLGVVGAVGLVGGAVAAAMGSGGGGGTGGGGGSTPPADPGLAVDCHPGTAPHPDDCDPNDFLTAEFNAMEGNTGMNVEFSLARGYDGSIYNRAVNGTLTDEVADGFVKVAVVDSGIDLDHPDLDGNLLLNLSVTCGNTGCVTGGQDTEGHGTEVAGIIAAERSGTGTGMHGVAPLANLMAIRFADNSGNLTSGDIPGIKYAVDNGAQVVNGSYGIMYFDSTVGDYIERPIRNAIDSSANVHTAYTPAELRSFITTNVGGTNYEANFQNLVNNHSIMVFAAGNDAMNQVNVLAGLPLYFQGASAPVGITQPNYDTVNPSHYDWSDNFVVAVALDNSNNIASYSNECGVAKNWCIAAPGYITKTTANGGGFTSSAIQGTSFAAPNVSGAIAVMLGAYPHLTPEQALQIIFDTATDLGTSGVDDVYGHGLVDLKKATSPADGAWTLQTFSSSSNYSSFSVSNSSLNLSPAFGIGLFGKGLSVMFVDKYNKDYSISLDSIGGNLQKRENSLTKLARYGFGVFSNRYDINDYSHVSYTMASANNDLETAAGFNNKDDSNLKEIKASYFNKFGTEKENIGINFNYKTSVADVFNYSGLLDSDTVDLSATGVYKNPYLNFSQDAKSSIVNYNRGANGFSAGAYQGTQKEDNAYEFDDRDTGIRGMFVQYSHKHAKGLVSVTAGANIENKTLLGSEAAGAFNISGNSVTYYSGLGAKYDLDDNISLVGNYHIGLTKADEGAQSFFTNIGDIVTDSFSLAAEYSGLARQNDRFGVAISQPLRVRNADATLTLPSAIGSDGNILYRSHNVSLAPTAREVDLQTYYGLELSEKDKLAVSGVYAINPQNMDENPNEGLLLLKYSRTLN